MRKSIEIYIMFSFGLFLTSDSVRGDEAEQEAPPAPAKKGGAILRVPTPFPAMTAVALTANGDLVAVAGSENTVKVWDVADGKKLHTLKGHGFTVITLSFSPDGKSLASATGSWLPDGAPGELKLWDVATGKERISLAKLPTMVIALAFSPDGKTLASASKTVKLWNVATGSETMELHVDRDTTWSLAFAPDGKTLATGVGQFEDKTPGVVILWDLTTGKERATLPGHVGMVSCVGFTPDGKTLASADSRGTLKLWDVATTRERATIDNPKSYFRFQTPLAFTADGKTLVATIFVNGEKNAPAGQTGSVVKQWEVVTGKELATLYARPPSEGFTALSANGKTVALNGVEQRDGNSRGTVDVWDVRSLATSPPKLPKNPEKPAATKPLRE
jgi:WD40 repeat protein